MAANSQVLDILAWNVYVGNTPADVTEQLKVMTDRWEPDVVVLMEASRLYGKVESNDYHIFQLKPVPLKPGNQAGQGNILIAVKKEIPVVRKGNMFMRTFWIGPKHGWPQDPRVYKWVKIKFDGKIWKIGGAHTPFGQAARDESRIRLVRWLRRTIFRRPVVLVLDANMTAEQFKHDIAGPAGARQGGVGIDLMAFKNCEHRSTINLGKHGSDHPALLYKFSATK